VSKAAPVGDGALVATLADDLAGLRDRAVLALASMCRRSELVGHDVTDVEAQRERTLLVQVRRSRGNQEDQGYDEGVS
jgi:hypothetical protein